MTTLSQSLQNKPASSLQVDAARELLARRRARSNLLDFITYTKPDYDVNWHHRLLVEKLERWLHGDLRFLMVFMPPRHGKSEIVSRRLPAYILGRDPNAQVAAISYSADLSSRMNRDVQRIIESPEYGRIFPNTTLNSKNIRTLASGTYLRNSDLFEVVGATGSYRSAGVDGGVTGMGFTHIVIDDPVKNRADANSPTIRKRHFDWYTSTLRTRLEKGGKILLTMTRWHDDDLAGAVLRAAQMGEFHDEWDVFSLPAIAEYPLHPDDPREEGEALWERRFSIKELRAIQALNPFDFEALYQQSPKLAGGGLFDTGKIEIIDYKPESIKRVMAYDLAVTKGTQSDYTAGVLMGVTDDEDVIIYRVYRQKRTSPELQRDIIQAAMMDGRGVHIRLEGEKGGIMQAQWLVSDPRLRGYLIDTKPPIGDKFTRAGAFASRVNAGKVKMVRGEWNGDYLYELSVFPQGKHDDQVDASSCAYDALSERKAHSVFTG